MKNTLFNIIAVMGTLGFSLGVVTGFWPVMLLAGVMAAIMYWLSKRLT